MPIPKSHQTNRYKNITPALIGVDRFDLQTIFITSQQITVIERPTDERIKQYLESATTGLKSGLQLTLSADALISSLIRSQELMPDHPGRDAFLTDIDALNDLYVNLIGCPYIKFRMDVINGPMCPKFHVDRTGIRLLCTYIGPGTEWLDGQYADRNQLASLNGAFNDDDSGSIRHAKGIHQVPTFAIALLKGSLWPGNQQYGAIHRSPSVDKTKTRVLIAIDAMWSRAEYGNTG